MMRLDVQVLCIIFREKDGHRDFLLLRRIPEKGGFWQPPSGGVESTDANMVAAVYREVLEETGIAAEDVLSITPEVHRFVMREHYLTGEPAPPVTEHVFGVQVRPGVAISFDGNVYPEHDDYRWVSYDDALSLLKWENNKDGFEKLRGYLDKK